MNTFGNDPVSLVRNSFELNISSIYVEIEI